LSAAVNVSFTQPEKCSSVSKSMQGSLKAVRLVYSKLPS
jgi:hypothetical protein